MSPRVSEGTSPVILGFPHVGTVVPDAVATRLNDEGRALRDTDWHLDQLYAGIPVSFTTITAAVHRYVIDVNRDPSGLTLYPGQNTTGLVPLTDFDDRPIWRDGQVPDQADIAERLEAFHIPYHAAFREQVERVIARHGVAIVFDCHSIRSRIPFLFDGRLPDLNLGSNDGRTCAPAVEAVVLDAAQAATSYSHVLNGRFKGGWTTRHYGRPEAHVHAIQLELAQHNYLVSEALPFDFDPHKASRLRPYLAAMLVGLERLALDGALKETIR